MSQYNVNKFHSKDNISNSGVKIRPVSKFSMNHSREKQILETEKVGKRSRFQFQNSKHSSSSSQCQSLGGGNKKMFQSDWDYQMRQFRQSLNIPVFEIQNQKKPAFEIAPKKMERVLPIRKKSNFQVGLLKKQWTDLSIAQKKQVQVYLLSNNVEDADQKQIPKEKSKEISEQEVDSQCS